MKVDLEKKFKKEFFLISLICALFAFLGTLLWGVSVGFEMAIYIILTSIAFDLMVLKYRGVKK